MLFSRGRHATNRGWRRKHDQRREHLEALKERTETWTGLGCRIVEQRGIPVLCVMKDGAWLEIGCDYRNGVWWFVRVNDARVIVPVNGVSWAARMIVQELESAQA
jgi:ketosteroid isomerase-like protein